jgi:hypothetical protein
MSENEVKMFGIAPEDRWRYVRLDSAKVNIAARSAKPTWFRLVPVSIGNVTQNTPQATLFRPTPPTARTKLAGYAMPAKRPRGRVSRWQLSIACRAQS